MADAAGTTVWRWDQAEPFGSNPADDDPDGNSVAFNLPLRLPGQRYDQETGLHYNYFRDYDPTAGRYLEADPIGLYGRVNAYAYVDADPISYIDLLGLKREWRHRYEIWQTTVRAGWGWPTSKRHLAERWMIYVNVPDCFVILEVRRDKPIEISRVREGDPSFSISGKSKPMVLITRDLEHTERVWGPRKGDTCCKGKETLSDFTYEKDPSDLPTTIKSIIDFINSIGVPGEDTLGKGGRK